MSTARVAESTRAASALRSDSRVRSPDSARWICSFELRQRDLPLRQKCCDLLLGLVQVRNQRGVGRRPESQPRERLVVLDLPTALRRELLLDRLDPGLDRGDLRACVGQCLIDRAECLSA